MRSSWTRGSSWFGLAPADGSNRQWKKIEDYRPGYPQYTALIAAHDRFFLFRRFDKLRARLMLSKQDRLSVLEQQLEEVDQQETADLFLGESRGDLNQGRIQLLSEIDTCLTDYDECMERTSRALNYDHSHGRDVKALQNWLDGTGSIARTERAYLAHSYELVCLAQIKDNAVAQLEDWVEDKFIRFFGRRRTGLLHSISAHPNIFIYPGSLISRVAQALLLIIVMSLILVPIIVCNMIGTMPNRIVVVTASTLLYLLVLTGLTKARTMELVLAGATYATVLIVFVSGTSAIGT